MNRRTQVFAIGVAVLSFSLPASAQAPAAAGDAIKAPARRPITFQDLISMHRISDPQISPNGEWIAYTVATPDLSANHLSKDIWIVPAHGGDSRQLTRGGTDERARWSPDSKTIAFLSSRDGAAQIYVAPFDGGEPTRITSLTAGVDNEIWSPDGKWLAFVSRVYPDCKDDACNAQRDAEKAASPVQARIYDRLLFRHWDKWWDDKRSHLFVVAANAKGGAPRDLTPGANYDVPPFNLFEPEAIGFAPDSSEIAFTANPDKDEALSTNGEIFTVPTSGAAAPKAIINKPGNNWGPAYSPDGKYIAFRAQMQPGFESDRWRLMLYDRASGASTNLTETFDRNVESNVWSSDSKSIYFQAEDKFELPVYTIAATAGSSPRVVLGDSFNAEFEVSADGRTLVFARESLTMPPEIFAANSDGTDVRQLTHQNTALLAQLNLPAPVTLWFTGAEKTQVQGLLLVPPNVDPAKKCPLLLLVHGGPQGEWDDAWSYRWNAQVMSAPGYAVLMINPRGSFGYGEVFTEEISRDWGGKVYEDLMKGVDAALAKYNFIDASRMAAAGGSYGGYMVDWIGTHTGRFKCLVSHAGPYDEASMYGETEELWFMEWEFANTPWVSPEIYQKWSPSTFAGALGKYKTPTLITAGELDYRVAYAQDLQFFTALQRQHVPSRLLIFPDEGHWILKPQNSQLWYKTVLDWLAQYLK